MDVVCAILIQNSKVLLAQRSLSKSHGGKWEFPGGKVQEDETLEVALHRELNEELNIEACAFIPIGCIELPHIKLHSFLSPLNSSYQPQEHRSVAWSPLDKLSGFDLCFSDRETLRLYSEEIAKRLSF